MKMYAEKAMEITSIMIGQYSIYDGTAYTQSDGIL